MSMFINRKDELAKLNKILKSERAELVLVYGRRRVGKSSLLLEAIKNKKAVYFLADMSRNILDILARQTNEKFVKFLNWDDFFEYIYKSEHKIFVIDEFQYLYNIDKAWPTILQRWWELLKKTDKKIILCGSILSTIYKIAMGYGSALYGRKTYEFQVEPLSFGHISGFFDYSFDDLVTVYSILGGVPRYIEEFDRNKSVNKNIKEKLIEKISFLYNEPMNLLYEEFRDATPYISILLAITQGYVRFHDIASFSRIESHMLPKYLTILERIRIIEKEIPVTEKKIKGKITRYRVMDNFYRFWFRFIFRNKSRIEQGLIKDVFGEIHKGLSSHVGYAFEDICKDFMIKSRNFTFSDIGRWWHKDQEIDIVCLNKEKNKIFFAECKWKENVNAENVMRDLRDKAVNVKWGNPDRKEEYVIFARSFSKKTKNAYDLTDLHAFYSR